MKTCPYCNKEWDEKHTITEFKMAKIIRCPEHSLVPPITTLGPGWDKCTADLSHMKSDMEDFLNELDTRSTRSK